MGKIKLWVNVNAFGVTMPIFYIVLYNANKNYSRPEKRSKRAVRVADILCEYFNGIKPSKASGKGLGVRNGN